MLNWLETFGRSVDAGLSLIFHTRTLANKISNSHHSTRSLVLLRAGIQFFPLWFSLAQTGTELTPSLRCRRNGSPVLTWVTATFDPWSWLTRSSRTYDTNLPHSLARHHTFPPPCGPGQHTRPWNRLDASNSGEVDCAVVTDVPASISI